MGFLNRFRIVFLLGALTTSCAAAYAAAPAPMVPEQGAVIDTAPEVCKAYKTPEERNWDLTYKPAALKNGESECSQPAAVEFRWSTAGESDALYTVELSTSPSFPESTVVRIFAASGTSCAAENLEPGVEWFWRVKADSRPAADRYSTVYSDVASFRTASATPRWFKLDGISNVRDAGGWNARDGKRVRTGMVFRGTEFDGHFKATEESRVFLTGVLGVCVDLDLRGAGEWGGAPDYDTPLGAGVRWVNYPVSSYAGIFDEKNKGYYREMFRCFAQPDFYPCYVHCWGGADRTGTVIIALKAVLGVSDSDLMADYEATSFSVIGERKIGDQNFIDMMNALEAYGAKDDSLAVKFVNFLRECGVTDGELDSIREILLEDAQ